MSSQEKTGIIIHQNMLLGRATANGSPKRNSSKKRRVTSSMIYLDEEPVFSDSEEELEYMRRIFGNPNHISSPKPKSREAEIQCDIISNEKTLIALIKKCSHLDPDVTTRFSVVNKYLKDLICLCEQIQSEMYDEPADFSDVNCSDEELFGDKFSKNEQNKIAATPVYASCKEFLPSSCGTYPQERDRLSRSLAENELNPSEPFECDEQPPNTNKKKVLKKRRPKIRNNTVKDAMRHSIREKKPPRRKFSSGYFITNEKKMTGEKGNIKKSRSGFGEKHIKNMLAKNSGVKYKGTGRISEKLYDLRKRHPDLESISTSPDDFNFHKHAKHLVDQDALFNIPLPKTVLKSLARNWMKPSKSFRFEETTRLQPHFTSLRQEKMRRLYSPSRWLESDEFMCSMAQVLEK